MSSTKGALILSMGSAKLFGGNFRTSHVLLFLLISSNSSRSFKLSSVWRSRLFFICCAPGKPPGHSLQPCSLSSGCSFLDRLIEVLGCLGRSTSGVGNASGQLPWAQHASYHEVEPLGTRMPGRAPEQLLLQGHGDAWLTEQDSLEKTIG